MKCHARGPTISRPDCGSLQRAGRGSDRKASRRGEGRNGGQIPRQEAPIILYSMATSTPEDFPRGMEFLYSLNRLNVAVSRARCVAVVVANPALFQVQCKTPRQIELANAFCRYLEMARPA